MSQKTHILEILEEMIGETGKWFFSGVMIGTLKSAISRIQKEVPDDDKSMCDFAEWYHYGVSNVDRGTVEEELKKWKLISNPL